MYGTFGFRQAVNGDPNGDDKANPRRGRAPNLNPFASRFGAQ